jgi:signal peptide peptidase SppA
MNLALPRIAARVFNTPLMVDAAKASAIVAALGGRMLGRGGQSSGAAAFLLAGVPPMDELAAAARLPAERAGRLGDPLGQGWEQRGIGDRILTMSGPVAVIPIEGTLVHKGAWLDSYSGETSYEGIQTQVLRAQRDDRVRGVVFEVDSFGGESAGAFDTAEMIAELSAAKPTIAILTDFALSAGYLLAAAARAIVLPETGYAGSIGVIAMHVDYSRAIANDGIEVTVISSGARKADGSPFKPLGDDVAAGMQANLDKGRDLFAATVAKYRGRRLSKSAALATEAECYRGEDAVDAGLADGVIRPSQAFDEFVERVSRNS